MKITIPKPCHENWETMTPDQKGRFCSVCSKTVKDLTDFSDEDLIESINSEKDICGRFTDKQLGRNLHFSLMNKLVFSLFALSGVTITAQTQELKGDDVKKIDFKKGIDGVSVINDTILTRAVMLGMPSLEDMESVKPLILFNNKKISEAKMKRLKSGKIKSVQILSRDGAMKIYGKAAENGAIIIEGKKERKTK